jgi:predicted DsbA family dithiol-disulfide isomerase
VEAPVHVVEVYADIRCPFAHVGLRRLVARREQTGADFALRVRAWPLELVNDAPLDPHLIAEEVEVLRAHVAPDLFTGFDPDRFPATSLPALAAAAIAYDAGVETGERVALDLRTALFEQGLDVASDDVLRAVLRGEALGGERGRALVEEDWRRGRELGVVGSPHFFVGGADFFCPALDVRRVDDRLQVADMTSRLDAIVALTLEPRS